MKRRVNRIRLNVVVDPLPPPTTTNEFEEELLCISLLLLLDFKPCFSGFIPLIIFRCEKNVVLLVILA
jgi:hypothetical protein